MPPRRPTPPRPRPSRAVQPPAVGAAVLHWKGWLVAPPDALHAVPASLAAGREPARVAILASRAIQEAVALGLAHANSGPRGLALAQSAAGIAEAARELMRRLDIPPDAACDFSGATAMPPQLELSGLRALEPAAAVIGDLPRDLAEHLVHALFLPDRATLPTEGFAQSLLLGTAPRTLGLIARLADALAEQGREQAASPGGRGRNADPFREALFTHLAGAHRAAFGLAPVAAEKARGVFGWSVGWAAHVLAAAARRFPDVAGRADMMPAGAWLADAAALSPRRLATLLRAGEAAWRAAHPASP